MVNPVMGFVVNGRDYNFFQKVTVSASSFGANNTPYYLPDGYQQGFKPDVIITFSNYGLILCNETSGSVVQVSFNGNTVHDELNSASSLVWTYENRVASPIWFQLVSGSPATVSIRAWSIR